MGLASTELADGWFPSMAEVRSSQTAVFDRRLTIGPADQDSDDFISTLSMGDWSGGGQIEELTGADQTRYWWGIFDGRSPRQASLPPLVQSYTKPSLSSGPAYPLGVVNDTEYFAFDDDIAGYDAGSDDWYTEESLGHRPVNKGVSFNGALYVPCGTNGYKVITESGAGNPTVTAVTGAADPTSNASPPTSNPRPVAFCVHEGNKLFALTTEGGVAYSLTGSNNDWVWDYHEPSSSFPHLESSSTPYQLISYMNRNGVPALFAIHSKGAHMWNRAVPKWEDTPIQFPNHPDVGRSAAVWRPGEDLWVSMGLDVLHYTSANVAIPLSGVNRDAGVPVGYRGYIADLEPELSSLYALVSPYTDASSVTAYNSQFGTAGTGDGQFGNIAQVALDSSGNVYVSDTTNDRVAKFNSSGAFVSNIITGVDEAYGVCIDSSDNVYVSFKNGTNDYRIRKYNSSGTLQWTTTALAFDNPITALATDGVHVYSVASANHVVTKRLCSNGSHVATFGTNNTSSSADGQYNTPYGIAYSPVTGNLYVSDQSNDRIQEITTTGAFVRKWGSSGTGSGQFTTATGVAVHPTTGDVFVTDSGRNDVQRFSPTGTYLDTLGETGTGNGQFTGPSGCVVNAATTIWIGDAGNDRVQEFRTTTTPSATGTPFLSNWTGVGWHGMWEGTAGDTITWMKAMNAGGGYNLWWGNGDGTIYRMKLQRSIHNPRQGMLDGIWEFAPSGYVETVKADMGMLGFRKIASHVILFMRNATSTESVLVEYEIDDGGWLELGTVTQPGMNILEFQPAAVDEDANSRSRGVAFQWIRFKLTMSRGGTTTTSPVIRAFNLHFMKIPQNSTSFQFTVPLPKRKWNGRGPREISDSLRDLLEAEEMVMLKQQDRIYRGRLVQVTGTDATGEDFSGTRSINFVEIHTGNE